MGGEGGNLRPLKRTLPLCRRKKNKISRFSMSKHRDREGGGDGTENGGKGEFSKKGCLGNPTNGNLKYTNTQTGDGTTNHFFFPSTLAHACSEFLCCSGDRGELRFPIKMPGSLFHQNKLQQQQQQLCQELKATSRAISVLITTVLHLICWVLFQKVH